MKKMFFCILLFVIINCVIFSVESKDSTNDTKIKTNSIDITFGGSYIFSGEFQIVKFPILVQFANDKSGYYGYLKSISSQFSIPFSFSYNPNRYIGFGFTVSPGFKIDVSSNSTNRPIDVYLNSINSINFLLKAGNINKFYFIAEIGGILDGNFLIWNVDNSQKINCFLGGPDLVIGFDVISSKNNFIFTLANTVSCTFGNSFKQLYNTDTGNPSYLCPIIRYNPNIGIEARWRFNIRKYLN